MPVLRTLKGLLVTHYVDLSDGSTIVVLAPGPSHARLANLVRVGADGVVVWRVEPPTKDAADAWVEVRESSGEVFASTWSCCLVQVDPATGSALSTFFTK